MKTNIKTLIISGGDIKKETLNNTLKHINFNNIIAVDKGLEILDECKIMPSYIIGDFDSVNPELINK